MGQGCARGVLAHRGAWGCATGGRGDALLRYNVHDTREARPVGGAAVRDRESAAFVRQTATHVTPSYKAGHASHSFWNRPSRPRTRCTLSSDGRLRTLLAQPGKFGEERHRQHGAEAIAPEPAFSQQLQARV